MNTTRRYRSGKYPEYDYQFRRITERSAILNPEFREKSRSFLYNLNDLKDLERLKISLVGETPKGEIYDPRQTEPMLADIPAIKQKLEELHKRHKVSQQKTIEEGQYAPPMDENLHHEILQFEARLDVYYKELEKVEQWITQLKEEQRQKEDQKVLKLGPQGHGNMDGGLLSWLDGQNVSLGDEGILIIDDERSPYDGMAAGDYHKHVVAPWKRYVSRYEGANGRQHARKLYDTGKAANMEEATKLLEQLKQSALEKHGKHLLAVHFNGHLIPGWPPNVKNYKTHAAKEAKQDVEE